MELKHFPFQTIDWTFILAEEHKGETGIAYWKVQMMNDIRIREVVYSPNYKADHWCSKGHIIFCAEGSMSTELKDGRIIKLSAGMCYLVGDNNEAHRTSTILGCKLFIVD